MATKKHINPAPTAAQSVESKPLPDREILKKRIERQCLKLAEAQALVSCIRARLEEHDDDSTVDATCALPALNSLLGDVGGYLDDELLAPAEATEVARD